MYNDIIFYGIYSFGSKSDRPECVSTLIYTISINVVVFKASIQNLTDPDTLIYLTYDREVRLSEVYSLGIIYHNSVGIYGIIIIILINT